LPASFLRFICGRQSPAEFQGIQREASRSFD
jgi:hypothetical protein